MTMPNKGLFWRMIAYIAPTSIGIWVLHPYAQLIIQKCLGLVGLEYTLALRSLAIPIVFTGCLIAAKVALKINGVRRMFSI